MTLVPIFAYFKYWRTAIYAWYIIHKSNFNLFLNMAPVLSGSKTSPITTDPGPGNVGTQLNFTPKYSIDAGFKLQDQIFISVGVRHVHESNVYIFGANHNPAFYSNGIFIGILFDRKLPNLHPLFDNPVIVFGKSQNR